jgi:hypothetical protein
MLREPTRFQSQLFEIGIYTDSLAFRAGHHALRGTLSRTFEDKVTELHRTLTGKCNEEFSKYKG